MEMNKAPTGREVGSAREAARHDDGRFGEQSRPEADSVTLDAPEADSPTLNPTENRSALPAEPEFPLGPRAWTEAYPLASPAANVAAFRGSPVQQWVEDRRGVDGSGSYIHSDGGYVSVSPDDEPTGHWFADGVFADGTEIDELLDGPVGGRARMERVLRDGPAAYRAGRGW